MKQITRTVFAGAAALLLLLQSGKVGAGAAGRDGSGLGLYISGELMKRMNGHLGCANTADGLAVTLLIPLS